MQYLEALTVCVGYDDFLAIGLDRWRHNVDRLIVVTTPQDDQTLALCDHNDVTAHTTNAFYGGDAAFNKGLAIEEARTRWGQNDWLLFFDADIIPPADFREQLQNTILQPGRLYGPWRRQCDTNELLATVMQSDTWDLSALPLVSDGEMAGYFQLFHATDPRLPDRNALWMDTQWPHAGGYDSRFQARWPRRLHSRLPFEVVHLGPHGTNWHGRVSQRWDGMAVKSTGGLTAKESQAAHDRMLAARRQGQKARHERIKG